MLLDEPTTGLHRHDVKRLLAVLQTLVERGHSVVVIEHNLDVLKSADWIIEIGPEAGSGGGRIVAEGPPEIIAPTKTETSRFLREVLEGVDTSKTLQVAENATPYLTALPSRKHELTITGVHAKIISKMSPYRFLTTN